MRLPGGCGLPRAILEGMNSRAPVVALNALALMAVLAAPASGQKNPPPPEGAPAERVYRVGLGLVAGTAGLGGALDLSTSAGERVYRFRLTAHDNAIGSWTSSGGRVSLTETALMIGRGHRFVANYGTVAAGLAAVSVYRGENDEAVTLGVPVEAQLISGGPIRIGATLAANVNLEHPFAAFILSLQLGRVPD